MCERVASRYVINEEGARRTAIIRPCDALERLLAGRVPNLQFDVLLLDLDRAGSKLDANGQVVLLTEPLICELEEQAGLADT